MPFSAGSRPARVEVTANLVAERRSDDEKNLHFCFVLGGSGGFGFAFYRLLTRRRW